MENYIYTLNSKALNNFSVPAFIAEQPAEDFEFDQLTQIGSQYGFLTALLGSPATQSIFVTENGKRKYRQEIYNPDTDKIEVMLGKTIWTELPDDIGTACCHTKPDVNACLTKAVPMRLCLKDGYDDLREHFIRLARQGFSLFGGQGSENEYWAELKAWFTFFQARDIMYGKVGVTGNNVASFPGVLDVLDKAKVTFSGADIIGGFEQIACRLGLLSGNYVAGINPFAYDSLEKSVRRGGILYDGWSMENGQLRFRGIRFEKDVLIPVNVEAGTYQIWVADLNTTGVYMERNLTDPFIETHDKYTDSVSGDCFSTMHYLKNYGFAFAKDYNRVFRITDCPLNSACLGEDVLFGLGNLITPDTLIPTYA